MGRLKRQIQYSLLALLAAAAVIYAGDYAYAKARTSPFSDISVDRMYAMQNRWGAVEYSVGKSETQRCVYSIFPHFGYSPCWYLKNQSFQYVHVG